MKSQRATRFEQCCGLAKEILHDRRQRRSMMMQILLFLVGMIALGSMVLEAWLESRPLLFVLYWLALTVVLGFLCLLSLYDLLRVRIEIRAEAAEREAESSRE